ncbi:hypothetical protein V6N13_118181 [Hibiscus sabdariffa]
METTSENGCPHSNSLAAACEQGTARTSLMSISGHKICIRSGPTQLVWMVCYGDDLTTSLEVSRNFSFDFCTMGKQLKFITTWQLVAY